MIYGACRLCCGVSEIRCYDVSGREVSFHEKSFWVCPGTGFRSFRAFGDGLRLLTEETAVV